MNPRYLCTRDFVADLLADVSNRLDEEVFAFRERRRQHGDVTHQQIAIEEVLVHGGFRPEADPLGGHPRSGQPVVFGPAGAHQRVSLVQALTADTIEQCDLIVTTAML